jgi:hypothetical protein
VLVIDPGMAPSQAAILGPLEAQGVEARHVTDVIISHHHPDHTMNVGLFGDARVHDHWAVYHHDVWDSRPAEGFEVSPSVVLWETPGHTPQDISTVIGTPAGLVVAPSRAQPGAGGGRPRDPRSRCPIHTGRVHSDLKDGSQGRRFCSLPSVTL